jgi:hypothetical protein
MSSTHRTRGNGREQGRRGAALVWVVILAVVLAGMSMALLGMTMSTTRARVETQNAQRSFYAAEAGISDAFYRINAGRITPTPAAPTLLGSEANPLALGPSSYWAVITQLDARSYTIDATGLDGRDRDRLELVMAEVPNGFFQYAAFGADQVLLNSNSFVDSFDSALGPYDSQVTGGNDFALEHGNVGSNGDIHLRANTEIHGDAIPGPGHVVDDSASNTYISGSTDPAKAPFPFPPIVVPAITSSGSLVGNSTVTLGPGSVHYSGIRMMGGSTLRIVGPAKVVIDDLLMRSNTDLVFDSTSGPIEVYGTHNFVLESNSTIHTLSNSAVGVTLLLSGDNTSPRGRDNVSISANSDFIGAIYAPTAKFSLASNFDVYGSIICKNLQLASYGEIHFDEALRYGYGATHEYNPALWRRLPRE